MEPIILIVGAGTFGTSTAYHLAQSYKDASRVTVIDRSPSPPKPAASVDVNRIIRTDYASPLYCNLAYEAIHAWFWSIELGHLFHKTGWLMMDEQGSGLSDRILQVFRDRGSTQTEHVSLDRMAERWDFLQGTVTKGFNKAYFNPEAGWCDAASATASFMNAAVKRGVKRVTGNVTDLLLDQRSGRIEGVRTADGQRFTADKVVLATGAWTSSLLSPIEDSLDIPELDRVERQVQATSIVSSYYTLHEDEVDHLVRSKMPVIVYGQIGEVIPPSKDNKTLKYNNSRARIINTVTTESGHRISVPAADDSQHIVPEDLMNETRDMLVSNVVPNLTRGKQPDHWRMCWDALSPTEDWLLCRHPHAKLRNLFLAVGGSFHSYKCVPPRSENLWLYADNISVACRFLPNAGKYMLNVLNGKSNGTEKDNAWAWKSGAVWTATLEKTGPKRELKETIDLKSPQDSKAKL